MPCQVPPEIKDIRSKKVLAISKAHKKEFESKYIGKTVEILVETKSGDMYMGHTKNYLPVYVESKEDICDKLITVNIKEYKDGMLIADAI